jgi:hypothetical protein
VRFPYRIFGHRSGPTFKQKENELSLTRSASKRTRPEGSRRFSFSKVVWGNTRYLQQYTLLTNYFLLWLIVGIVVIR